MRKFANKLGTKFKTLFKKNGVKKKGDLYEINLKQKISKLKDP